MALPERLTRWALHTGYLLIVTLAWNAHADETLTNRPAQSEQEMVLFQTVPSVSSASKYDQKVTEAPSSVSIITESDIKKFGYRTIADALRSVTSFYVTYDRNYSYIGVRGFGRPTDYNTRILILVDGRRMNDNIYDGAYVGTESVIDIDLVERIEIIRGPGSSLYGSNAFFAVVNILTKRGRDLKGAEISADGASFATYKGRLSYGNRFSNGAEALVSGSVYDSRGGSQFYPEYAAPQTNYGYTDHTDYDRYYKFFGKMSFRDVTFDAAYMAREKGIPTGSFQTDFNNPGNETTDDRAFLDLKYEHSPDSRTDVLARVYFDYYRYEGNYIYSGILNRDLGYGDWWGGELRLSKRILDAHRVILGAEYRDNIREDQKNYNIDSPAAPILDDSRRSKSWAAYAQDELTITKNLLLNAGVRYDDYYYTFGSTVNPRLALIYNSPGRSTIKLLYGSAFRTPNAFELYWKSPPSYGNKNLEPEHIKTYSIVYEKYLGDRLRVNVTGYAYHITSLISQVSDGTGRTTFQNVDEVTAHGAEFELDNKWMNGIEGRISYTIQRTKNNATGEPLTNSPAQLAKLNIIVPLINETTFCGIEEQYMSRRRTENGNFTGDVYLTNLTVFSQQIMDRFEASVSVYNALNRKYGDPVGHDFRQDTIQQDGRTYRLKLTYAF